ncbi:MAG: hypothetical protein WD894_08530 [Pirellulales bacterium]
MRRIIYASAAAAVLASSTGCQQCWDSFRRFEAWKFHTVFGRSPEAYDQVVAMPATLASPVCDPITTYSPIGAIASPAATISPSPDCACSSSTVTTVPSLPGTLPPGTTFGLSTPGPTGQ